MYVRITEEGGKCIYVIENTYTHKQYIHIYMRLCVDVCRSWGWECETD